MLLKNKEKAARKHTVFDEKAVDICGIFGELIEGYTYGSLSRCQKFQKYFAAFLAIIQNVIYKRCIEEAKIIKSIRMNAMDAGDDLTELQSRMSLFCSIQHA